MKKRACSYEDCKHRRVNWSNPDVERGIVWVEVPDDYPENKEVYCSYSCAALDGKFNVRTGWKE